MREAEAMREAAAKVAKVAWLTCPFGKIADADLMNQFVDYIAETIRALPLPEPTADPRDAALEKARTILSACLQDYGDQYFTDRHGMADRIRPALAAIDLALKGGA